MSAALAYFPPLSCSPDAHWVTKDQLVERAQVSGRWIEMLVAKSVIVDRETDQRGRNGRLIREYLVSSLPADLRARLEPKRQAIVLAAPPASTSLALFLEPVAETPRVSLSPAALRLAEERHAIIRPLLDFAAERAKYSVLRLRDGRRVESVILMAEYIAETRPVAVRTLFRWVKGFRTTGLSGLARQARKDAGTSHFFTRFPAAGQLAAAEYLKPYATFQRAMDAIYRDAALLRIPEDELPVYQTVRRFLEDLPAPMRILAREGLRRYNETCAPHLTRGYTDIPAGAIYVADHMIHDCEVANDCFPSLPSNAPMRLRLTCIMDLRSRKMVGFCWAVEGDSRAIATALRRAVERFGVPEIFYCDNGQDFKKVARGAKRLKPVAESEKRTSADQIERAGALQKLGCRVQFCLPYHAQSKPIERAFRTVHLGLDGIMHTYLTGNSYNRPDAASLAGAQHRRLLKHGRAHESTLLPASFFIKLAETWIEQDYNAQHAHGGKGMDGRTPDAVFLDGNPPETRRTADPTVLAMLLHERRTVKVMRTAVTVDKRRYMPVPSSPDSWVAIHEKNGSTIVVAFDPLDPARMVALNDRGQIVAELQPEEMAAHPLEPTQETRTQIAQMSQIRGRLLKANSIAIATMHEKVAMAGHKSALEHLADRAQVTVPVDALVSQRIVRRAIRPSDSAHAPASSFDIANDLMKELA